jgi:hypothetical protein
VSKHLAEIDAANKVAEKSSCCSCAPKQWQETYQKLATASAVIVGTPAFDRFIIACILLVAVAT